MAASCPLENGDVVFSARTVLYHYGDTNIYHHNCENILPNNVIAGRLANNLSDDQNQQVDISKDINMENDNEAFFEIYPNPTNNQLNMFYKLENQQEGTFMLYNAQGSLLVKLELIANQNQISIPIENLDKGLYIYKIVQQGKLLHAGKIAIIH